MAGNGIGNNIPFFKGIRKADINKLQKHIVLYYNIDKQNATNEKMVQNPILKDFSGNNHYATCNNFSFGNNSGIGSWPIPKCSTTGNNVKLINNYKCVINNINFNGLKFPSIAKDNGEEITIRIKVTNVNSKYNLSFYYYSNITGNIPVDIMNNLKDGITAVTINKSEFRDNEVRQYYICYRNAGDDTSINTTIEILQDYDYNPPTININNTDWSIVRDGYKFSFIGIVTAKTNMLIGNGLFNELPSNKPIRIKAYKHGLQVFFTEKNGGNKKLLLSLQPYEEGEFIIDFDYNDNNRLMFSANIEVSIGETFSFEFLPTYDKYLLFDGVDDYAQSEYINLTERFTVAADVIFINPDTKETAGLSKSNNFYIYNYVDINYAFINTGNNAEHIPKNIFAFNLKHYYFKNNTKQNVNLNQEIPNNYSSVLRIGSNTSTEDRICTKIAIRKIIIFDKILTDRELELVKTVYFTKIDLEAAIRDVLVCHYDIAKQGATNETLSSNPILKDLYNNGNDANLIGFDYKGMSGIGGYYFKTLHSDTNNILNYEVNEDYSLFKFISTKTEGSIFYGLLTSITIGDTYHYKIKVTGLNALRQRYPNIIIINFNNDNIEQDGEYEISGVATYEFMGVTLQNNSEKLPANTPIDITIEQLPLYPNALVSDGIDDYAIVKNKYNYDFTERPIWRSFVNQTLFDENTTKNTITLIKTNSATDVCYDETALNIRLKIKGLKKLIDDNKLVNLSIYPNKDSNTIKYTIINDGIYDINISKEQSINSDSIYFVLFRNTNAEEEDGFINFDEPVIIEQLPTNKSLIFNKDDGYTVIAKKKKIDDSGIHLVTKAISRDNYAEFIIGTDNTYNFGQYNKVDSSPDIIVQTSHKFNGKPINIGNTISTDTLALFRDYAEGNDCGAYALYALLVFNRDLTDEEIEYVKTNLIE